MAAQQVELGGIGETGPPDPIRTQEGALPFRVKSGVGSIEQGAPRSRR